jgi:hypothetical protein
METLMNWGIEFVLATLKEVQWATLNILYPFVYTSSAHVNEVVICWVTVYVKVLENGRLVQFWKRTDHWCAFSWSICEKPAKLLGVLKVTVSKVMSAYATHQCEDIGKEEQGQKSTLTESSHRTLRRIVRKIIAPPQYRWQQNRIFILKTLFPQKLSNMSFTNPTSMVGLQLLNLILLKVMLGCINNGVTTIRQVEVCAWYAQMSHPSGCSLHQEEFVFGEHPRSPQSGMPGSNSETRGGSVMVWTAISWYSILLVPLLTFIAELLQGNKWTGWVIRCISWSTDVISKQRCSFHDDYACIHIAGTVQL